jgi:hypothetical protein
MTIRSLQEMLDRYSGKSQQKIMKTCEPFFQTFGLNHFFHQSISNDGLFYGMGTNLDFMHYYVDQRMHESNPFIIQSDKFNGGAYPFSCGKSEPLDLSLQFAKKKFGIHHCLLIIENDTYGCHQYGFGISSKYIGKEFLLINELPLIKVFINYFKQEMASILKDL